MNRLIIVIHQFFFNIDLIFIFPFQVEIIRLIDPLFYFNTNYFNPLIQLNIINFCLPHLPIVASFLKVEVHLKQTIVSRAEFHGAMLPSHPTISIDLYSINL